MPKKQDYFFVSYSRRDIDIVNPLVARLNEVGIQLWRDVESLSPGEDWAKSIERALTGAAGLLVFISSSSVESKFVMQEINAALFSGLAVLPVVIGHPNWKAIPGNLAEIQWLVIDDPLDPVQITQAVYRILLWANHIQDDQHEAPKNVAQVNKIAEGITQQTRGFEPGQPQDATNPSPDSVFIVHGHDDNLLAIVKNYLNSIGVRSVVLKEIGGPHQSLLQKFLQYGTEARFAVVLLSGDDYGASLLQYNDQEDDKKIGDKALQFRARQNVILEWGFFYGRLGWERVFVLYKKPTRVFPNFERPSDLDGIVFDTVDVTNTWQGILHGKLTEAGFVLRT